MVRVGANPRILTKGRNGVKVKDLQPESNLCLGSKSWSECFQVSAICPLFVCVYLNSSGNRHVSGLIFILQMQSSSTAVQNDVDQLSRGDEMIPEVS